MGACPCRGAWLRSVGLLGVLALLRLPRASGDCSTLPAIPHAHPEENYDADKTFSDGTTITYKCDTGYVKLPGKSNSITCQGGEWSEIPQFCDRSCNAPGRFTTMQLDAAFINKNYFPINSTVTFVCRPGHTLSTFGPLISTCQDDGTWSPVSGSCKKKSCPHPGDLEHGRVDIPTDTLFGSQIEYSCFEGYTLVGDATRHCHIDGNKVQWTGDVPVCNIITCAPPPDIQDGKHNSVDKDFFNYGEAVTYRCESSGRKGLSLIGDATIFCDKDGQWNKSPPQCKEVKCKIPQVDNAIQMSGFGPFYTYKDTIEFACKEGYIFQNNSRITCEADNNWSPALPVCYKGPVIPPSKEPPVSSHPGTSLPPSKEPSGLGAGIVVLIVIITVIVLALTSFIIYRQYNKRKGTYIIDEIHKEETYLNSLTPPKEDTLMKERFT
ncbi:complement decay-accelerating factor-like isoform X3 [Trichosurus vulpecula]|uniref:complement decay-accelerating factor-like isoform X3 n=2 Tax=Trichosurus vulpecula TaxID=9337 RepID=UPI00186B1753|nr:complement decay-accelerating factor-like isoform X3 [Trichosurus vulpecula]